MDAMQAQAMRQLLERQEVAALGTLHKGEPYVSMVPYALAPGGAFVIHVSRLATHTRDMELHPGVSLLVTEERTPEVPPQALPRVTVQGQAVACGPEAPLYAAAREAYLSRFPNSQEMFGFADFSLFVIEPRALRVVGGFAQAWSITAADYARFMAVG
ncbi:MAG TPA: pyridoxamine 5'-phosphate oxidase family protein [Ramlibacter sp.]|uniref:HugZ family pyridoxamine 5'-phosphate oxidase n=1 Tax=Ramlibacter sp. TaxID=1917967 RepID=UPI002D800C59|nr:pyridoxamine 5'-phosphate oxidase family protein [Ramlibacter sp.]HET8748557.1 pyridoxamine 5'-phosphate oxidase family protein [Ramlibacter sp.]